MIWKFITFLVRILDPEKAHNITLLALKYGLHPRLQKIKIKTKIKNLEFTNPLGIAAGFDKNAEVIKTIHSLNFGFTEVGTITPISQYGNPKPRVFRLEKDKAIINRNGFNNLGMEKAKKKLEDYRRKFPVGSEFLVGINIGPNKDSKNRFNDYEKVKVPMLPNVKSIADTKNQIIYYTILLILLSYAPLYSNLIGYLYLILVTVLNIVLIQSAFKLKNTEEVKDEPNKEGLKFFAITIFYLFSLFNLFIYSL